MNFNPEAHASQLEKELQALDREYHANRKKYVQAIDALRGTPQPKKEPDPHANTPQFKQLEKITGAPEMTRGQVIDLAIQELPGKFTTAEIKEYIAQRFPKQAETIKGSYLPTTLAARAKSGTVKLLEASVGGGPNTWVRTQ